MSDYFEPSNMIKNGYWYTFTYSPKGTNIGFDRFPFIYCIEPSLTAVNNFCGLNIHFLPMNDRIKFILEFEKATTFIASDKRCIFNKNDIINLFPAAGQAIRYYNRKNIENVYRIKNQFVPRFIDYDGDFIMKDPGTIMNKYLLKLGYTLSTEGELTPP